MSIKNESRTDRALELVRQGMTRYRAAKECGIALSTIYRAVNRERNKCETKPSEKRNG